jgi:hypothetical protein
MAVAMPPTIKTVDTRSEVLIGSPNEIEASVTPISGITKTPKNDVLAGSLWLTINMGQ